MRNGTMMNGWGWMAGGLWLWLVLTLLVVVGVVALVVALVRATTNRPPPSTPPREDGPREILDARYARGEIDREAYLQARRDLGDPAD